MSAWREPVTLTGRHVTLRPLREDDADALAGAGAASGLAELFYTNSVALMADPAGFVAKLLAQQAAGRALPFVVETPAGEVVGATRFLRMNEPHRRLEIGGTFYVPAVRRSGLNTDAKRLLLGHAFDTLGANVVQIRTDGLNRISQAAIERLGAKRDGWLRAHEVLNGRVRDVVCYSILAAEWPGVRMNLEHLLRSRA